jgi:hypothetical protein
VTNRRVDATGVATNGSDDPEAVVQTVARTLDETGFLHEDLPIYDAVDPEAIDRLRRHAEANAPESTVRVEFDYDGHGVVVEVGRHLRVEVG